MKLTKEKTKTLGYNLWYQLWIHPECEYKDDLLKCDEEASMAYRDVEYFPECCVFCEYDAQQRIMHSREHRKKIPICKFCPLEGDNGDCCYGYYRKWALSNNTQQRKLYAKAILDLIKQWKF